MGLLHTVNKSPFERNSLQSCLRCTQPGSAILLIEDGVYAALQGTAYSEMVTQAMGATPIYALQPDLEARGMQGRVLEGIRLVDYGGFVDLAAQHSSVQSWL